MTTTLEGSVAIAHTLVAFMFGIKCVTKEATRVTAQQTIVAGHLTSTIGSFIEILRAARLYIIGRVVTTRQRQTGAQTTGLFGVT
jgi:hypothetical protein